MNQANKILQHFADTAKVRRMLDSRRAPIDTRHRAEQIAAAQAKRDRKNAKRQSLAG